MVCFCCVCANFVLLQLVSVLFPLWLVSIVLLISLCCVHIALLRLVSIVLC